MKAKLFFMAVSVVFCLNSFAKGPPTVLFNGRKIEVSATSFIKAYFEDQVEILELLANAGMNGNFQDENGESYFGKMVGQTGDYSKEKERYKKIVERMLQNGAILNPKNGRRSPLQIAVCARSYDMAKLLIQKGADVNYQNSSGENALFETIELEDPRMAKILLDAGAEKKGSHEHWFLWKVWKSRNKELKMLLFPH